MAISAKSVGTWAAASATTQTVTLPTHAAGDMLIVRVAAKGASGNPPSTVTLTVSTSGWAAVGTQFQNGTNNSGNGTGSLAFRTFWKIATSSAETNPVVDFGGVTPSPSAAVAVVYQKAAGESWRTPIGAGGGDSTARTAHTATIGSHITVTANDMVDFWTAWCDNYAATVPNITQTGVTFGTVAEYPATALSSLTGNDIAADGGYRLASSGTSSAAAVVTGTFGNSEEGGSWQTRLRAEIFTDAPAEVATAAESGLNASPKVNGSSGSALAYVNGLLTDAPSVIDTFDRGDNASLGANWANLVGYTGFEILSNSAYAPSSGYGSYNQTLNLNDRPCIRTTGNWGAGDVEVLTRITDVNSLTAYGTAHWGTDTWVLRKYVSGTATLLGAAHTYAEAVGRSFSVEANGSTITLAVANIDGQVVTDTSIPTNASTQYGGIQAWDAGSITNFLFGAYGFDVNATTAVAPSIQAAEATASAFNATVTAVDNTGPVETNAQAECAEASATTTSQDITATVKTRAQAALADSYETSMSYEFNDLFPGTGASLPAGWNEAASPGFSYADGMVTADAVEQQATYATPVSNHVDTQVKVAFYNGRGAVFLRATGSNESYGSSTCYEFRRYAVKDWRLRKIVSGVATDLATYVPTSEFTYDDQAISAIGSTLRYTHASYSDTVTDTSIPGAYGQYGGVRSGMTGQDANPFVFYGFSYGRTAWSTDVSASVKASAEAAETTASAQNVSSSIAVEAEYAYAETTYGENYYADLGAAGSTDLTKGTTSVWDETDQPGFSRSFDNVTADAAEQMATYLGQSGSASSTGVRSSYASSGSPIAGHFSPDGSLFTRAKVSNSQFATATCYEWRYVSTGTYRLNKVIAGTVTQLGSDYTKTQVNGESWRIVADGSLIIGMVADTFTPRVRVTDTSIPISESDEVWSGLRAYTIGFDTYDFACGVPYYEGNASVLTVSNFNIEAAEATASALDATVTASSTAQETDATLNVASASTGELIATKSISGSLAVAAASTASTTRALEIHAGSDVLNDNTGYESALDTNATYGYNGSTVTRGTTTPYSGTYYATTTTVSEVDPQGIIQFARDSALVQAGTYCSIRARVRVSSGSDYWFGPRSQNSAHTGIGEGAYLHESARASYDFASNIDGWASGSGTATWDNTEYHTASGSLKIVAPAQWNSVWMTPASYLQITPNGPPSVSGKQLYWGGWVKVTSGTWRLYAEMYDADKNYLSNSYGGQEFTSATWTQASLSGLVILDSAHYVSIGLSPSSAGGTAYLDEPYISVRDTFTAPRTGTGDWEEISIPRWRLIEESVPAGGYIPGLQVVDYNGVPDVTIDIDEAYITYDSGLSVTAASSSARTDIKSISGSLSVTASSAGVLGAVTKSTSGSLAVTATSAAVLGATTKSTSGSLAATATSTATLGATTKSISGSLTVSAKSILVPSIVQQHDSTYIYKTISPWTQVETLAQATTAGNTIVVTLNYGLTTYPPMSVTDSAGNIYVKAADAYDQGAAANRRAALYYCLNAASATTVTLYTGGSANSLEFQVYELADAGEFRAAAAVYNTALVEALVASKVDDLVISTLCWSSGSATATLVNPINGFTWVDDGQVGTGGSGVAIASAHAFITADGNTSARWNSVSGSFGVVSAAFHDTPNAVLRTTKSIDGALAVTTSTSTQLLDINELGYTPVEVTVSTSADLTRALSISGELAVSAGLSGAVAVPQEVSGALSLTALSTADLAVQKVFTVGQAAETDTATAVAKTKYKAVFPAGELGRTGALGAIQSMAYGDHMWVATTDERKIFSSPDLARWTYRDLMGTGGSTYATAVAYGNGYWVAINYSGMVSYSTDGIAWTETTPLSGHFPMSVRFLDGKFVSVGWGNATNCTIAWTTDPSGSWTLKTDSGINGGRDIAFSGTTWAISSDDSGNPSIYTASTLSGTWTEHTTTGIYKHEEITYGPSGFVIAGTNSSPFRTTATISTDDGATWTTTQLPQRDSSAQGYSVVYGNGLYAISGYGGADASGVVTLIWTSADLVTWTAHGSNFPQPASRTLRGGVYADGVWAFGASFVDPNPNYPTAFTSTDGDLWGPARLPEVGTATALTRAMRYTVSAATETDTATAVTAKKSNTVGQSTETSTAQTLTRIKRRVVEPVPRLSAPYDINTSAFTNTNSAQGVVYHSGRWVAITSNQATWSADNGVTWQLASSAPAWTGLEDLIYVDGTGFVAIDNNGKIYTSSDGDSWTTYTELDTVFNGWASRIRYNGSQWVVAGDQVWTATALNGTWTQQNMPPSGAWFYDLIYVGGHWVAVGEDTNWNVWTSTDGVTWTPSTFTGSRVTGTWEVSTVAGDESLLIAAGSPGNKDWYLSSTDSGLTWTVNTWVWGAPFESYTARKLVHDPAFGWVLGGSSGVYATSADGVRWSGPYDTPAPAFSLYAMGYGNGKLLYLGDQSATPANAKFGAFDLLYSDTATPLVKKQSFSGELAVTVSTSSEYLFPSDISAELPVTASTSADLTRVVDTSAELAVSTGLSATLSKTIDVSAALAVAATSSGTLDATKSTSGALTETVTATGAFDATKSTSGSLAETATTTGVLGAVTKSISGSLAVTATATSVLGAVTKSTSGALAETVSTAGVLAATKSTSGTLAEAVSSTGTLARIASTSGALAASVASSATLSRTLDITAELPITAAVDSTVTKNALDISAELAVTATADSTVTKDAIDISGALQVSVGSYALLLETNDFAGIGQTETVSSSADLYKVASTSGALAEIVSSTADLAFTRDTSGSLAVGATAAAALDVIKSLSGSLPVTATASGDLAFTRDTAAELAVSATLTGDLTASKSLSGELAVTESAAGVLDRSASTSGSLTATAATSGALERTTPTEGALAVTAASSGTLTRSASISGALNAVVDITSVLDKNAINISAELAVTTAVESTLTKNAIDIDASLPVTWSSSSVLDKAAIDISAELALTAELSGSILADNAIDGTGGQISVSTSGVLDRTASVAGELSAAVAASAELAFTRETSAELAVTAAVDSTVEAYSVVDTSGELAVAAATSVALHTVVDVSAANSTQVSITSDVTRVPETSASLGVAEAAEAALARIAFIEPAVINGLPYDAPEDYDNPNPYDPPGYLSGSVFVQTTSDLYIAKSASGELAEAVTSTGTLDRTASTSGELTGTASSTADLAAVKSISGSLTITESSTADLTRTASISGALAVSVETSGTLARSASTAGELPVSATSSADLDKTCSISGELAETATVIGTLDTAKSVSAELQISTSTSADLSRIASIDGALTVTLSTTELLTFSDELVAGLPVAVSTDSSLERITSTEAELSASATASAELAYTRDTSAELAISATAVADLSKIAARDIEASLSGTVSTESSLTRVVSIEGSLALTAAASADLARTASISGALATTATADASLTAIKSVSGELPVSAVVDLSTLERIASISGALAETATSTAALSRTVDTSATLEITETSTAALARIASISGALAVTATPTSLLLEDNEVAGSRAVTVSTSAVLDRVSTKEISGELPVTAATSAVLSKPADTSAALDVTASTVGTLVRIVGTSAELAIAVGTAAETRTSIERATETDTAFPITVQVGYVADTALETDTANPITPRHVAGIASTLETDTATALVKVKIKMIGQALETDIANDVLPTKLAFIGWGIAW